MQRAALPAVFGDLRLSFVQKVSDTEYSSECPRCGGEPHPNGEWPDRFRIFTDGHSRAWCRHCSYFIWADQANGDKPPDPQELDRWRNEQIQHEEARKRSAERALINLRDAGLWQRYHDDMDAHARAYWRSRGIPDSWQDWWRLGWVSDFTYFKGGEQYKTPSATIPIFAQGWQLVNIKHRLIKPADPQDRYRYQLAGQGQPLWVADPDVPAHEQAILVEGEIKAMVVSVTLAYTKMSIAGLPGITPKDECLAPLQECALVTMVLDPGSEAHVARLVKMLPKARCRILIPPAKIDDGILAARLTKSDLSSMLRAAVPA